MQKWLEDYCSAAEKTDKFAGKTNHLSLLGAGLIGETGSIIAEIKKGEREKKATSLSKEILLEEFGDFFWYFTRIARVSSPEVLETLIEAIPQEETENKFQELLLLSWECGEVLKLIHDNELEKIKTGLNKLGKRFTKLILNNGFNLEKVADENKKKIQSRWPEKMEYHHLFDKDFSEEEQLPRNLSITFIDREEKGRRIAVLRCNGLNFGDRLSDNIKDPDFYRYHDIFHFSYAVHLGWSPVIRSLFRCKRKSLPNVDEAEDGQRAVIIEEAVTATVFSRAKELNFFEGLEHVDYDLLKMIRTFISGYEVESVPLWQWERAILDGFKLFRLLKENSGGQIEIEMNEQTRKITFKE
jgi:NTP pyrophosphatase (non-canonical NTP hydrolase)